MKDQTKSFWWQIWGRPARFFLWLTALLLLACLNFSRLGYLHQHEISGWEVEKSWTLDAWLCGAASAVSAFFLVLSLIRPTRPIVTWVLRRWFFCAAVFATLAGLFYAEENWRGQRALERSKRELAARGAELDWDKFIPPAVPDDQNVFKAPKMQEWFVLVNRNSNSNELTALMRSPTNFPTWGTRKIESDGEARAYLAWSDRLQPQFNLIRDALKRPYSRMDGDYSRPRAHPIPNFIVIREVARVLAQRTHCYLLVHEPDKAVAQLALMHDLSHLLDAKPTGKPMTLVGAMVNVAVVGVYADVIGEGLRTHAWQEPQLVELQKQLSEIHTLIPVAAAFESAPAASARALETVPVKELANAFEGEADFFRIAPRGWIWQNIANEMPFFFAPAGAFNAEHDYVSPRVFKDNQQRLEKFVSHKFPFRVFAALLIPNIGKAEQNTARNQNTANEALAVCALERYRIAHGSYPVSLDALAPQFIDKVPGDVINGGQLQYRRSQDSFVLYSLGWDERDDGGSAVMTKSGQLNPDSSDWVWAYSPK
jgi:hypothetical protein